MRWIDAIFLSFSYMNQNQITSRYTITRSSYGIQSCTSRLRILINLSLYYIVLFEPRNFISKFMAYLCHKPIFMKLILQTIKNKNSSYNKRNLNTFCFFNVIVAIFATLKRPATKKCEISHSTSAWCRATIRYPLTGDRVSLKLMEGGGEPWFAGNNMF